MENYGSYGYIIVPKCIGHNTYSDVIGRKARSAPLQVLDEDNGNCFLTSRKIPVIFLTNFI